jgi:acetate CoA/acetoacetate CoA-transferase alpha subunit
MEKVAGLTHTVEMIPDGASLMIGGFLGVGTPHRIIDELVRRERRTSPSSPTTQAGQSWALAG